MSRVFHLDEPVWIDKGTEIAKLRKELAAAINARRKVEASLETSRNEAKQAKASAADLEMRLAQATGRIQALEQTGQSSARSSTAYRTLCDLARMVLKRLPVQNDTRVQAALLGLETFMDNNPALVGAPVGTGRVRNEPMRSAQRVVSAAAPGRDGARIVTETNETGVLVRYRVYPDGRRHRLTDDHMSPEDPIPF